VLLELHDGYPDTVFYDIFLQNGINSLYPVPVKVTNYVLSGTAGVNNNQNDPTQGKHCCFCMHRLAVNDCAHMFMAPA
jgi:hypothetical protein